MINFLALITLTFSASAIEIEPPKIWQIYPNPQRRFGGRVLFAPDAILRQIAEDPNFTPNDWTETAEINEKGDLNHDQLRDGWAFSDYESETDRIVFLEGRNFRSIFVNGERFVGDFYRYGNLRLPIPLKKGKNRIFVQASWGGFQIRFSQLDGTCSISPHDRLLPDLRENVLIDSFGTVVVLNHTDQILKGVHLNFGDGDLFEKIEITLDPILPFTLVKPTFPIRQLRQPIENELDENQKYQTVISISHGKTISEISHSFTIKKIDQLYRETKRSAIDGSVQYFAVVPPRDFDPHRDYALYLSLHGAAVEARGQAACYQPKSDAFIVAPTNRRPYGFDWQEWGRLDALETLDLFSQKHKINPKQIYLTGHSMGGHGTWYLGTLYPSRFAAIGPAAGWITFASYRDKIFGEVNLGETPFVYSDLENDVFRLVKNLTDLPIYILHGEKDDNVPVTESHKIINKLEKFHKNFIYHEQPGAGHWFGNECVDWQPMIEFFRRHQNPIDPLAIQFSTPNPAIASECGWLKIHSQISAENGLSEVIADARPRRGKINISTKNISHLQLDLSSIMPQKKIKLQIDEIELDLPTQVRNELIRTADGNWQFGEKPDLSQKGSHRNGPFKMAFDRDMVWIYGTHGTPSENAAIIAKVRYDAQSWWYRGNGNVEIVADVDFNPDLFTDRNVILYGNFDNNSAFSQMLDQSPIRVYRDRIEFGDRIYEGDYGVYFAFPRKDSDLNLIGVIGLTSEKMIRSAQDARYFVSGVSSPDYVIYNFDVLEKGFEAIAEVGYFDQNWKLKD